MCYFTCLHPSASLIQFLVPQTVKEFLSPKNFTSPSKIFSSLFSRFLVFTQRFFISLLLCLLCLFTCSLLSECSVARLSFSTDFQQNKTHCGEYFEKLLHNPLIIKLFVYIDEAMFFLICNREWDEIYWLIQRGKKKILLW